MRRSRGMTSEATGRVPVVAHRPAATPTLLKEIARPCPPPLRSVNPAGAEADSVPETDAAATLTPALPLLEEAAGAHVGGLGQGSLAGWCAFPGGPASRRLPRALARAQ
jgi:hypothetical protein